MVETYKSERVCAVSAGKCAQSDNHLGNRPQAGAQLQFATAQANGETHSLLRN